MEILSKLEMDLLLVPIFERFSSYKNKYGAVVLFMKENTNKDKSFHH